MENFLRSSEGSKWRYLLKYEIGSPEFDKEYNQAVMNDYKGFDKAQKEYIDRTHYMPIKEYAKNSGFNVNDTSIQEALYSMSVQHSPQGTQKILEKVNPENSNEQVLQDIYNSRKEYVNSLNSLTNNQKSILENRYNSELNDILTLNSEKPLYVNNDQKLVVPENKNKKNGFD
jgi:hypothetical protein